MTIKNIPVGYKDSPLGIIPMEWEVKRLGEIGTFYGGGTPSKSIDEYWHGDIPWISSADLIENDIYWCNINRFITLEAVRNSSTQIIPQNSILIVTRVGVGKVAVAPCDLCVSQDYICLQNSGMNTIFLAYEIMQRMKNIVSQIQGTSIKGISINEVKKIQLPLPPLAEQEKIAEILSTWDKAIEKQIQLIQKLELRKKGLMQQLLTGKKRLPGFTGEWKKVKFGDCVEIYRGGSPRPIERFITNQPDGINWIKIGDVKPNEKYINRTEERIDPEGVSRSRQVYVGDFILSNSMSFGRPYILNIDGCIHDGWLVIQNYHTYFDKDFLYYMLCSENVMAQYVGMAAGSSVKNLNKEKVASLLLYIPKTIEEQQAIAKLLDVIDHQIEFAIRRRKKFYIQKNGLMQQLLTSKKRVRI